MTLTNKIQELHADLIAAGLDDQAEALVELGQDPLPRYEYEAQVEEIRQVLAEA